MTDPTNPERRSDSALLLFGIGAAMCVAAYFLGLGAVIAMVLSGGNPVSLAGGAVTAVMLGLAGVVGVLLMLAGAIWLIARVIADSRDEHAKERYSRDVER